MAPRLGQCRSQDSFDEGEEKHRMIYFVLGGWMFGWIRSDQIR